MDELQTMQSMGLTLPSPAYLFGMLLFSVIGFAAYRYGKKAELPVPRLIGVALMLYSYLVDETWLLYAVGSALCVAAYVYRR